MQLPQTGPTVLRPPGHLRPDYSEQKTPTGPIPPSSKPISGTLSKLHVHISWNLQNFHLHIEVHPGGAL